MTNYHVCWEIDIEEDSPYDAAKEALFIMQDKESEAVVFKVIDSHTDHVTHVDLIDWEEQERAEILGETLSDEQMEELEEALYSDMHGKIS
jgi:hypothetical protein